MRCPFDPRRVDERDGEAELKRRQPHDLRVSRFRRVRSRPPAGCLKTEQDRARWEIQPTVIGNPLVEPAEVSAEAGSGAVPMAQWPNRLAKPSVGETTQRREPWRWFMRSRHLRNVRCRSGRSFLPLNTFVGGSCRGCWSWVFDRVGGQSLSSVTRSPGGSVVDFQCAERGVYIAPGCTRCAFGN